MNPDAMSPGIGFACQESAFACQESAFACQESAFACQARRSFVALTFGDDTCALTFGDDTCALAFGDDTCALTFPDQAGFAGARGTGGDVTFRYARAAA